MRRGRLDWNVTFVQLFNDWELEEVQDLLERLSRQQLDAQRQDVSKWIANKKGYFIVRSCYEWLIGGSNEKMPSFWECIISTRVRFYMWDAWNNKILTLDKFKRRGVQLASMCYLYRKEEETTDLLLLHCETLHILWIMIFCSFRGYWVMVESVKEVVVSWRTCNGGKQKKRKWKAALCSVFWTI